jgi:hypothetical protein
VRDATAQAQATVTASDLGADRREVELRWTDALGAAHVSRVRVPEVTNVKTGVTVTLRYVPADPSRVYVGGDETSVQLRNLAYGVFVVTLVLVVVLAVSLVHVARRRAAERRPATTMPVSYTRSKRGLVRRSWLVLDDHGREWWVPVHWEPVLARLLANTPCSVHGRPSTDRILVVDVEGTPIWQSGRKRPVAPRGDVRTTATQWSASAQGSAEEVAAPPGLGRQLRADAVLIVVAPLLGLLWAYLDGSGRAGFAMATVLMACVLFWLPAIIGSDPT